MPTSSSYAWRASASSSETDARPDSSTWMATPPRSSDREISMRVAYSSGSSSSASGYQRKATTSVGSSSAFSISQSHAINSVIPERHLVVTQRAIVDPPARLRHERPRGLNVAVHDHVGLNAIQVVLNVGVRSHVKEAHTPTVPGRTLPGTRMDTPTRVHLRTSAGTGPVMGIGARASTSAHRCARHWKATSSCAYDEAHRSKSTTPDDHRA